MKKLITIFSIVALAAPVAVFAQVPYTGPTTVPQISTYEDRVLANVDFVMQANGISRSEAIAHVRHALDSQGGKVGRSSEIDRDYSPTYNPAYNAFQQMGQGFYAGKASDGRAVFTDEQRHQVLEGIYRYCQPGLTYTYEGVTSACK